MHLKFVFNNPLFKLLLNGNFILPLERFGSLCQQWLYVIVRFNSYLYSIDLSKYYSAVQLCPIVLLLVVFIKNVCDLRLSYRGLGIEIKTNGWMGE